MVICRPKLYKKNQFEPGLRPAPRWSGRSLHHCPRSLPRIGLQASLFFLCPLNANTGESTGNEARKTKKSGIWGRAPIPMGRGARCVPAQELHPASAFLVCRQLNYWRFHVGSEACKTDNEDLWRGIPEKELGQ